MLSPRNLIHPRDELMRLMERIYRYRMTTTSGGNLSVRDATGDVWITPARVDKGGLRRDDIIRVRADGSTEGPHRPSSEYPFHQAIYAARSDLGGIVHAHPVGLVAFSICREVPDTRVSYQAARVCGEVGFAPYGLPGSQDLGQKIAAAFAAGSDCVILENHGVVIGGKTVQAAFERFETLEFTAQTILRAQMLGAIKRLADPLGGGAQRVRWRELETVPAATPTEQELRRQLSEFVQRAYRQRLVISTQGAFSARLNEQSFLITPHRADRQSLSIEDLVLIQQNQVEPGKDPSSSARQHAAIYARHPDVHAIVNAYPVNATAFSITDTPFDSRTIPESYIFLRDVVRLPAGARTRDPLVAAEAVSLVQPIAILENDGVLVCGRSVFDAFDRLEVLETTAEAMINSRPIGQMQPMPPPVIEELIRAFLTP